MSAISLDGKVAVVTGAGRGLGQAYAVALAAAGAAVVVNDVDDERRSRDRRADRRRRRARGRARSLRSASSAAAQQLVDRAVSEFGRLDMMVTNAGVLRDRVLWKMTDEDFDLVIETHLRGTFTLRARRRDADARAGRGRPDHRRRLTRRPVRQLRPDQLRRGQGRHRHVRAHLVAGARARRDHGQRDRADGLDADDGDASRSTRRWSRRSRPASRCRTRSATTTRSACPRSARRWSCSSPPTQAAGITGQAIGIGGDRLTLYSHPAEAAVALRDGGWDAEAIAAEWESSAGGLRAGFGRRHCRRSTSRASGA